MKTDTIKAFFTYLTAFTVVVGGIPFLFVIAKDTTASQQAALLIPLISGFVGSALTFLWGAEVQTRTARATERALMTQPPSTTTIDAGPPVTVTTTPSDR